MCVQERKFNLIKIHHQLCDRVFAFLRIRLVWWITVGVGAGMVRSSWLMSYACLYTTADTIINIIIWIHIFNIITIIQI